METQAQLAIVLADAVGDDRMAVRWGWMGAVMMLSTLAVVGALIYALRVPTRRHRDDSARRILDERYDRGEIDADEHRTRTAELSQ